MDGLFTTQQYVDKHKLGIQITDPQATRILAAHLKSKGFVKVRRKGTWFWAPAKDVPNYQELKAKLEKIK